MSNSSDKRPEYERYNKIQQEAASLSDQPMGEYGKNPVIPASTSPEQTAAYLADMLQEMQSMAVRSGHSSLSEMLEFAHREAVWRSQPQSGPSDKP